MSIKLEIKKKDNSPYWLEHFNDLESANKWIEEEKTRPYWDSEYTYEIIEIPENTVSEQELVNNQALKYLRETDYYVIRMMDIGTPIPNEIQVLRQQARDRIV